MFSPKIIFGVAIVLGVVSAQCENQQLQVDVEYQVLDAAPDACAQPPPPPTQALVLSNFLGSFSIDLTAPHTFLLDASGSATMNFTIRQYAIPTAFIF